MGDLTEHQARKAETDLMRGRLGALVKSSNLTARERMGACRALEILDDRSRELSSRDETKERS